MKQQVDFLMYSPADNLLYLVRYCHIRGFCDRVISHSKGLQLGIDLKEGLKVGLCPTRRVHGLVLIYKKASSLGIKLEKGFKIGF